MLRWIIKYSTQPQKVWWSTTTLTTLRYQTALKVNQTQEDNYNSIVFFHKHCFLADRENLKSYYAKFTAQPQNILPKVKLYVNHKFFGVNHNTFYSIPKFLMSIRLIKRVFRPTTNYSTQPHTTTKALKSTTIIFIQSQNSRSQPHH